MRLASDGVAVLLGDINVHNARKVAEKIKDTGRKKLAMNADVTKNANVDAVVEKKLQNSENST